MRTGRVTTGPGWVMIDGAPVVVGPRRSHEGVGLTEIVNELVGNPAHRHVLLNHLPITGLAVAAVVLAWGIFEDRWTSIVFGLSLCIVTSASAVLVMQSGDAAYPLLFERLDGHGQAWLDHHLFLAERYGRFLPVNALLAAVAIGFGARRPRWRRRLAIALLVTTSASLLATSIIAEAGGKVRHDEFRTTNPPVHDSQGREGVKAPSDSGVPVAMRRLTEAQYRRAIADVFGPEIEIAGRFEPDGRREGLVAVSSAFVTVTPSGFEQYEAMAREVARQVVSEPNRSRLLPCAPADPARADAACSEAVLRAFGPRILRRPLEEAEIERRITAAAEAADRVDDFFAGIELIVTSLLVAPDFLFRIESVEQGAGADGRSSLSEATLASRLSFLLWNAGPDDALLSALAEGRLADPESYAREVDRMLGSPRFEAGVRAFFEDLFRFDEFSDLGKDPLRYPMYSAKVAADAREQTLRVVVDHLVARQGDYRELFTTRRIFMTRTLGPVYALPVHAESGWEAAEFAPADRRAGILTHASFNLLNAHPGRSSPTLRGLFLREALLCQNVPPAPANVDFGLFNADDDPQHKTARDRLAVHSSAASCRNCHALTDPIGLGLENFDGIGRYRASEGGAAIDAGGDLDGEPFADAVGLGQALARSPLVGSCLVETAYRYAVGRGAVLEERPLLRQLGRRFEQEGYRIAPLMREIALSEGFRTAVRPAVEGGS